MMSVIRMSVSNLWKFYVLQDSKKCFAKACKVMTKACKPTSARVDPTHGAAQVDFQTFDPIMIQIFRHSIGIGLT